MAAASTAIESQRRELRSHTFVCTSAAQCPLLRYFAVNPILGLGPVAHSPRYRDRKRATCTVAGVRRCGGAAARPQTTQMAQRPKHIYHPEFS